MATFTVEVSGSEKYILDVNTSTADNFNSTSSQDKFFLEIQQGTSGTAEANKNIIEITTSADSDSDASSLTIEKVNDINLVVTTDFVVSHPTISAASSVNNDGSLFIQDVLLDQYGHVTGLAAAYATGTGIGGGSSTFLNLTDTPSSFVGQGSKFVAVNSAASALEFVSGVSSSSTDAFVTGISYNSTNHNLVLSTHSGTVTGVLSNIIHSGDNISQLVNDSGYITGLIEDTNPTLSANLQLNNNNIVGTGNISISGNVTANTGIYNILDMTPLANGSAPTHSEGLVWYDVESHALVVYNDEAEITQQLGQEEYLRVRNNTTGTISNGSAVRINGAHGNAAPTIELASATTEDKSNVVGIVTHDIETNSFGYVTTFGIVRDVDTSDYSAGDELYLSITSGALTGVAPTIPNYSAPIGYVIRSHSNGSLLVELGKHKLGGGDLKSEAAVVLSGVPFVTTVADTNAGGLTTSSDFVYDSGNQNLFIGGNEVVVSGDNISLLTNDSGYATTGQLASTSGDLQNQIDAIPADTNTFVTGLTFDSGTNNLVLQRNDTVSITGQLEGVLVSGTDYHITVNGTGINESGRTYVQDILVDSYGHITGVTTATETGVDTNTEYTDGTGLVLVGTEFNISGVPVSLLNGIIDSSNLPSYVDDVLEYNGTGNFPASGTTSIIYLDTSGNDTYRWGGGSYIELTDDTAVWGQIGGTLSNQTDVYNAINAKAASGDNVSIFVNDVPYAISGTHITITNAASNVNNSGNDFVQDLLFDQFGHVTGVVSQTVIDNDVNTFVTGITYNSATHSLVLDRNSGSVTGVLNNVIHSGDNISLLTNDANYIDGSGYIQGSGTNNFIPVFSGVDTIRDSIIHQSGNTLGINTPAVGANYTIHAKNINPNNDSFIVNENAQGNSIYNVVFEARESGTRLGAMYSYGTAYSGGSIAAVGSGGTAFTNITGPVAVGPLDANKPLILGGGQNRYATIHASEFRINPSGLTQDFIVHGTGDHPLIYTDPDSGPGRVGIGTNAPVTKLDVSGTITASGGNSTQWNTAYGWGDHSTSGYLTAHPNITSVSSSDNSGRTYIQDILLDSNGHVTGIATGTETVTDTNTEYTAGTGLDLSGTEFNIDSTVLTTGSSISSLSNVNVYAPINNDQVLSYSSGFGFTNTALGLNLMKRGSIPFGGYSDSQMGHYFFFDGSSEAVINTDGDDINFRVEGSGGTNLLFTDAGTDRVGIGTATPAYKLDVVYPDSGCVRFADPAGSGIMIGDCALSSNATYAGMQHTKMVGTYMMVSDGDDTYISARDTQSVFIRGGGNAAEAEISIHDVGVGGVGIVFNEQGADRDIRMEGASDANLFRLDASTDRIGIGTATPAYTLDVAGSGSFNALNINDAYTFPTGDGTAGHSLVTDGAGNIVFSGIAGGVGGSGNLVRGSEVVTATTGLFDVSGGYSVGTLDVYQNGIKLFEGASYDYTATNGSSFSLINPATSGDLIEYLGLNTSTNAVGNTSLGTVTVTSNQDVFNTVDTFTSSNLAVFLNGVKLVDGEDYNVTSASQFTLDSVATSGDIVEYIAYGATVASSNLQKTGDTMTGNLTVNADLIVKGYKETHTDNGNTGTAQTIDISNSTLQTYTLTGNCTFTMPTADAGRSFTMFLKTGAGSFSATFTGVKFPDNVAPTISTAANRMDILTFYSDGTNWYGSVQQEYYV